MIAKNLAGHKSGLLTVSSDWRLAGKKGRQWKCQCDCGNTVWIYASSLSGSRATRSCGCMVGRHLRGRPGDPSAKSNRKGYSSWRNMIRRCHVKSRRIYARYGAVGIRVCDRWMQSFDAFIQDVGEPPSPHHSIDRYPNRNGNYEPGNCRWATVKEQNRNTKRNCYLLYKGEYVALSEVAEKEGVSRFRLRDHLSRCSSLDDALLKCK